MIDTLLPIPIELVAALVKFTSLPIATEFSALVSGLYPKATAYLPYPTAPLPIAVAPS